MFCRRYAKILNAWLRNVQVWISGYTLPKSVPAIRVALQSPHEIPRGNRPARAAPVGPAWRRVQVEMMISIKLGPPVAMPASIAPAMSPGFSIRCAGSPMDLARL
jgi:hypothetical protein